MDSTELIFEVHEDPDGGFWARALGPAIFTQGESWEELRDNIRGAVECHYDEPEERPPLIRLHFAAAL